MNHMKIMLLATGAIVVIFLLSGCADKGAVTVHTVEVKVPVPVRAVPPKELFVAPSDIPTFYQPSAPGVSSCLVPAGETQTQILMKKLDGWQKYGTAQ